MLRPRDFAFGFEPAVMVHPTPDELVVYNWNQSRFSAFTLHAPIVRQAILEGDTAWLTLATPCQERMTMYMNMRHVPMTIDAQLSQLSILTLDPNHRAVEVSSDVLAKALEIAGALGQ